MTNFTASFRPHGLHAAAQGLLGFDWAVRAEDLAAAVRSATDVAGRIVGKADFACRERADGSMTILDTVCGSTRIGTLSVRPSRRR